MAGFGGKIREKSSRKFAGFFMSFFEFTESGFHGVHFMLGVAKSFECFTVFVCAKARDSIVV